MKIGGGNMRKTTGRPTTIKLTDVVAICTCKCVITADNIEAMNHHGFRVIKIGRVVKIIHLRGHEWWYVPDIRITEIIE